MKNLIRTYSCPIALLAGLAWMLCLGGCASTDPLTPAPLADGTVALEAEETPATETDSADENMDPPPDGSTGRIVRVNEVDRYVIVNCRRLPSQGEEAKVFRNEWQAGTIRFVGPSHRPFASADIVTGQPEVGDLVLP